MQNLLLYLFFHIYSSLISLLSGFILPLVHKKGKKNAAQDLRLRKELPYAEKDCRDRTVVWIHAASLGESKLLYNFLGILHKKHPDHLYVVTAVTRSGVDYLRKHQPECVVAAGYLPLDTVRLMSGMIRRFQISQLWLLETEIWPAMLWVCTGKDVSINIANGRMEEQSFNWYRRFSFILKPLFRKVAAALVQTDVYAERFCDMGVEPSRICVTGNLKGKVRIRPPVREKWLAYREQLSLAEDDLVFTAGCIHPGEGKIITSAVSLLRERGLNCKCIMVPRHREKVSLLAAESSPAPLILQQTRATEPWECCIVDSYGVLDMLYSIADFAFVGGTFKEGVGGHNVWEAAQYGIPVFFGPHFHTQQESCDRLLQAGTGFSVSSSEELANAIIRVLREDALSYIKAHRRFSEELEREQNSIEPFIP